MERGKRLAAGVLLAFACVNAFAWAGFAADGRNNTYVYWGSATEEGARRGAAEWCKGRDPCGVRAVVDRTVIVVAKGDGGWGQASNPDPKLARDRALAQCREVSKGCRITQAVWDPGAAWGAVALGTDTFFLRTNAASEEEAQAGALEGCRKRSQQPDACRIAESLTTSDDTHFAVALSDSRIGVASRDSLQQAKEAALAMCQQDKPAGETCKVTTTAKNAGLPAPKGYAELVALAKRNAAQNPAPAARTVATTRTTQRVSCNNQCVNGDCIRTFPDGRKERWQAPRTYNSFTRNWEWDTTTNACGG